MPNNDLRDHLTKYVSAMTIDIVRELEGLVERRAVQLVAERLGVAMPNGAGRSSRPARSTKRATPKSSGRGNAADRIVSYVQGHPGVKSEAVRAALKINVGTWGYHIRKLVESRQLRRQGTKRTSVLFPG